MAKGDLVSEIHNLVEAAHGYNALICGANQVTKQVNHGKSQLVLLAANCQPLEIILHLVLVCEEKGVPYVFIPCQKTLGGLAKLSGSVAAASISKHDALQPQISLILRQVELL